MPGAGAGRRRAESSDDRLWRAQSVSKLPSAVTIGAASGADQFQKEAICAGLHPAGVLVYAKRVHGRANRPFGNGSTVAPIVTAH